MLRWKTMIAAAALVAGTATIGQGSGAQEGRQRQGNAQETQRGGQQKERVEEKAKEKAREGGQDQKERVQKKAQEAERKGATPERAKAKAREVGQTGQAGEETAGRKPTRAQLNQHFSELSREVQLNRRHAAQLDRLRELATKKGDKARLKQIADLVDRETDRHSRVALAIEEKMGEKYFAMAMKRLKADMTNIKRKRVLGEEKKP